LIKKRKSLSINRKKYKAQFADKNLPGVPASVCVAQALGTSLGNDKVLLGTLSAQESRLIYTFAFGKF
jgi:precorrin-3B methylase